MLIISPIIWCKVLKLFGSIHKITKICPFFSYNELGIFIIGLPRRLSINNRTHPAVHVHPHRDIVSPAGNTRGLVSGGQVFVSPPPPYPTQQPITPGVGHSTGHYQTSLNPSPHGTPPHGPPPHGPSAHVLQGPSTYQQHGQGHVPPPFEYIPPGAVLYK